MPSSLSKLSLCTLFVVLNGCQMEGLHFVTFDITLSSPVPIEVGLDRLSGILENTPGFDKCRARWPEIISERSVYTWRCGSGLGYAIHLSRPKADDGKPDLEHYEVLFANKTTDTFGDREWFIYFKLLRETLPTAFPEHYSITPIKKLTNSTATEDLVELSMKYAVVLDEDDLERLDLK